MLTTRHGVRPLGTPDLDAFLDLAGRDPVVNVFVDHRARTTNLEPRWLGGEMSYRHRIGMMSSEDADRDERGDLSGRTAASPATVRMRP